MKRGLDWGHGQFGISSIKVEKGWRGRKGKLRCGARRQDFEDGEWGWEREMESGTSPPRVTLERTCRVSGGFFLLSTLSSLLCSFLLLNSALSSALPPTLRFPYNHLLYPWPTSPRLSLTPLSDSPPLDSYPLPLLLLPIPSSYAKPQAQHPRRAAARDRPRRPRHQSSAGREGRRARQAKGEVDAEQAAQSRDSRAPQALLVDTPCMHISFLAARGRGGGGEGGG